MLVELILWCVSNMLLVLSITFHCHYYIWGFMSLTGPFQLSDWKDIFIAHVIIIITSEVSTLPIAILFCRGCVPGMFVISYSVTCCIYIPGKPDFVFIVIVQFMLMINVNSRMRFSLQIVFVCLYITPSHCHHRANLSEYIELIKYACQI